MPVPLLKRRHFLALILAITIPGIAADLSAGPRSAWQPASPAMLTPWGEHVSPENAWNDYPRPSLVRPSWQSLNGLWDFTVTKENSQAPVAQGKILVPFCIESSLSGVGRPLEPDEVLWYNRTFETASHARGRGFGARLFDRAAMHARNEGVELLFIHALSENTTMLRIARNAGAKVEKDGSEAEAFLRLPAATLDSRMTEIVEEQLALTDYRLKAQAKQFWDFLAGLQEIRGNLRAGRRKSGL